MKLSTGLLFVALQVVAQDCDDKCGANTACVGGMCEQNCHSANGCCSHASKEDAKAGCSAYSTDCVCKFDSYCCDTAWDSQCIEEAMISCNLHCNDHPSPIVSTTNGAVRGARRPDGVAVYNIPYAQAPTDSLRFMPPVAKDSWTGVFDGTTTPVCPQVYSAWTSPFPPDAPDNAQTEDCLFVGVYVPPSAATDEPLPVFVFIHGGSFSRGDQKTVKAWKFALKNNVIVVSVNYRLGMLGFFPLQQIKDATQGKTNGGSNGFLDQVMALEWVRDNIGAFGGNPDDVTLGGHSAGSISACALNFSPLTRGLFKRLILASFSCTLFNGPFEESAISVVVQQQIALFKAATTRDINAMSIQQLQMLPLQAVLAFKPMPAVDGTFLKMSPSSMMQPLLTGKMPVDLTTYNVLMSATSLDGVFNEILPLKDLNPESYERTMKQLFGTSSDDILGEYPTDDPLSYYKVTRDFCVVCAKESLGHLVMTQPQGSVSFLKFSYPTLELEGWENAAEHQGDLNMVFGYEMDPAQTQFPYDQTTSDIMMEEYGKFINTGTGTATGLGSVYNVGKDGAEVHSTSSDFLNHCGFWSTDVMPNLDLVNDPALNVRLASWCSAITGLAAPAEARNEDPLDSGRGWYW